AFWACAFINATPSFRERYNFSGSAPGQFLGRFDVLAWPWDTWEDAGGIAASENQLRDVQNRA
ncbi:349_t:CDS:1, partial [Acaulospora colombiana]